MQKLAGSGVVILSSQAFSAVKSKGGPQNKLSQMACPVLTPVMVDVATPSRDLIFAGGAKFSVRVAFCHIGSSTS